MRRLFASVLFALLAVGTLVSHAHAAPVVLHAGSHPSLQRGSTGSYVMELQRRLNAWGGAARLPITGTFGPATERAVKAFQAAKGLPVLGIVGPRTWAALPPDVVRGADPCTGIESPLGGRALDNCILYGSDLVVSVAGFDANQQMQCWIRPAGGRNLYCNGTEFTDKYGRVVFTISTRSWRLTPGDYYFRAGDVDRKYRSVVVPFRVISQ